MVIKIKNEELIQELIGEIKEFPRYTTQILNLANQNSQGTRPRVVGQLSELVNYLLAKDQVASRFIDLTNVNASPSFCLMSDCIPKPDNYILSHWLIHRNG